MVPGFTAAPTLLQKLKKGIDFALQAGRIEKNKPKHHSYPASWYCMCSSSSRNNNNRSTLRASHKKVSVLVCLHPGIHVLCSIYTKPSQSGSHAPALCPMHHHTLRHLHTLTPRRLFARRSTSSERLLVWNSSLEHWEGTRRVFARRTASRIPGLGRVPRP